MSQSNPPSRHPAELFIPIFILVLLLVFTYGFFFQVPYSGFYFNPSDGRILRIFEPVASQPALQEGDQLRQIGPVSWDAYHADRRLKFFENLQPGQTVEITVERDGQELTIPWRFPGFNREEFLARFVNVWWLAFIFFSFGLAVQFFLRPKDVRWRLLTAANYLTACWLMSGSLSSWHIWESSGILHATTWLMLPVYLNFHWIFPRPLWQVPSLAWIVFYALCFVLAAGELLHLLPRSAYSLGFLFMLVGSIVLLIVHFVRQPSQRRVVGLLAIAILIALAPSAGLAILSIFENIPQLGPIGLFALPIMPATYIFVVYRRNLGGLELPANRLLSIYTYLILVATLLIPLVVLPQFLSLSPQAMPFLAVVITIVVAYATIRIFPAYQAFVEKNLLGIKLPYQDLPEIYSARITTSASLHSLIGLLDKEILPSLLVRQFAFLQLDNKTPKLLLNVGVSGMEVLADFDLTFLSPRAGRYLPVNLVGAGQPYPWVRLILPLRVGEDVLGFWLLGRRDPDDLYAQPEIPILQSLANQTAIALGYILQTERLRSMYQANVNRFEDERLHLAHELHDSILNQLAVLQMNLDASKPSQKFQDAYDRLTERLREIVSDLRPPMLNYGLKLAIDDLAEKLTERSNDSVNVVADLQTDGSRYPLRNELHLFRIVQEACENALRHGQAKNIKISGIVSFQEFGLDLEDDGVGFKAGESLQLDALIANKHFGLAGMMERAAIIGAEVRISSIPEAGTHIEIRWEPGGK